MTKLNHFILWCKNWYEPIDKNENVFDTLKRVLKLDGYEFVQTRGNVLHIVLNYMDELRDSGVINTSHSYLRFAVWHDNIAKNMTYFNNNYEEALIYTIRNFFAFEITSCDIPLYAPIYSRKLYKMGLTHSNKSGITYKEMNRATKHNYRWAA